MSYEPNQYPGAEPAQAAPGWYPVDNLSQRYWDGFEWTSHVAPLGSAAPSSTSDQRTYALIMHLGSLFVGFLVPLIMWLIKKDESDFIDDHGKQIMNWSISAFIYAVVSLVLILVLIGVFMLLALAIMHFVFSIMGAVAANKGERFKYPLTIPFFS